MPLCQMQTTLLQGFSGSPGAASVAATCAPTPDLRSEVRKASEEDALHG